jgi:hypothetical protein
MMSSQAESGAFFRGSDSWTNRMTMKKEQMAFQAFFLKT